MKNIETRSFKMHPNLLLDVIRRQAGTLGKAAAEAVGNAWDAGSTFCHITLTPTSLSFKDDGKGFGEGAAGRENIEKFFEVFGTPHQEGDSKVGEFRMGRGQLLSFGANTWRTGTHAMRIDIQKDGLDYQLEEHLDAVTGCAIDIALYEPLTLNDMIAVQSEILDQVKHVAITVTLNGQPINTPPADMKWDLETDDAWFKFKGSGPLTIYNLGFLVMQLPAFTHGVSGVVVSKQRLVVNFARNAILETKCSAWKRIKAVLGTHSGQAVKAKNTLNDDERTFLARKLLAVRTREQAAAALREARVITDVRGRHHTVLDVLRRQLPYAVAPALHDARGERIHQLKQAFVLAPVSLERLGYTTATEFCALIKRLGHLYLPNLSYRIEPVVFEELAEAYTADHRLIPLKELSPEERAAYGSLRMATSKLHSRLMKCHDATHQPQSTRMKWRELLVGESDTALAWTDGHSKIIVHRKLLAECNKGLDAVVAVLHILLHEFCHDTDDRATHDHDLEFYSRFEEAVIEGDLRLASLALATLDDYAAGLRLIGKRINKKVGRAVMAADLHAQPA